MPPDKITQEAFEGDDRHLQRLVCLKAEERADAHDLWKYLQDLRYTKIQGSLLAYALPFCLDLWREDLRGVAGYGGFVEHLYPVLANCNIFKDHLTRKQSAAVSEFMQGAILQEIDDQRGLSYRGSKARPYRWIGALNTYGVFRPDIERLWTVWWSLETVGRAVGALQYISCLMYPINENPVFAPWTSDNGGGPPCLWEFEGHLYSNRWLETNITFLKGILSVRTVSEVFNRAADGLAVQPEGEVAEVMRADLPLLTDTLQARCAELPRLLETMREPGKLHEWTI